MQPIFNLIDHQLKATDSAIRKLTKELAPEDKCFCPYCDTYVDGELVFADYDVASAVKCELCGEVIEEN